MDVRRREVREVREVVDVVPETVEVCTVEAVGTLRRVRRRGSRTVVGLQRDARSREQERGPCRRPVRDEGPVMGRCRLHREVEQLGRHEWKIGRHHRERHRAVALARTVGSDGKRGIESVTPRVERDHIEVGDLSLVIGSVEHDHHRQEAGCARCPQRPPEHRHRDPPSASGRQAESALGQIEVLLRDEQQRAIVHEEPTNPTLSGMTRGALASNSSAADARSALTSPYVVSR